MGATYAFPESAAAYLARQSGRMRARAESARHPSIRAAWLDGADCCRAKARTLLASLTLPPPEPIP